MYVCIHARVDTEPVLCNSPCYCLFLLVLTQSLSTKFPCWLGVCWGEGGCGKQEGRQLFSYIFCSANANLLPLNNCYVWHQSIFASLLNKAKYNGCCNFQPHHSHPFISWQQVNEHIHSTPLHME